MVSPVKIPGFSFNYLLTSLITSKAAFPTALIAQEENTKTTIEPKSPPIKTSGIVMSTDLILVRESMLTSSMNALNRRKQAKLAEATEYPLAFALVTFPTASSLSVIFLTPSAC